MLVFNRGNRPAQFSFKKVEIIGSDGIPNNNSNTNGTNNTGGNNTNGNGTNTGNNTGGNGTTKPRPSVITDGTLPLVIEEPTSDNDVVDDFDRFWFIN